MFNFVQMMQLGLPGLLTSTDEALFPWQKAADVMSRAIRDTCPCIRWPFLFSHYHDGFSHQNWNAKCEFFKHNVS